MASLIICFASSMSPPPISFTHLPGSRSYSAQKSFLDPWGNRIEIVGYDNIQFTKAPNVLRGMGLTPVKERESDQRTP
jgi:hypothetical protein